MHSGRKKSVRGRGGGRQLPCGAHPGRTSTVNFCVVPYSSSLFDIHGKSHWDLVNFQKKKKTSHCCLVLHCAHSRGGRYFLQQMRKTFVIHLVLHTYRLKPKGWVRLLNFPSHFTTYQGRDSHWREFTLNQKVWLKNKIKRQIVKQECAVFFGFFFFHLFTLFYWADHGRGEMGQEGGTEEGRAVFPCWGDRCLGEGGQSVCPNGLVCSLGAWYFMEKTLVLAFLLIPTGQSGNPYIFLEYNFDESIPWPLCAPWEPCLLLQVTPAWRRPWRSR